MRTIRFTFSLLEAKFPCHNAAHMKLRRLVLHGLGLMFCLFVITRPVLGQVWQQTSAPTNYWVSIACTADGKRIFGAPSSKSPLPIYVSTNSGSSWQVNPLASLWYGIGCSADGEKLVAVSSSALFASTNSGASWLSNNLPNLRCVAGAADGTTWIAAGGASVYTSTNSGMTWLSNNLPNESWACAASSTNGSRLVVAGYGTYNGPIYVSNDSGSTWRLTSAPNLGWDGVAASADGLKLVAVAGHTALYPGVIYVSTNGGTNWTLTSAPDTAWACVASSADGSKLLAGPRINAAATAYLPPYFSTNSGSTWWPANTPARSWTELGSSADGSKFFAASYNGGIYLGRALPILRIAPTGGNVMVSWTATASAADFTLQQTTNLLNESWSLVTNTPMQVGDWRQVTLPPSANISFHRLKCP